MQIGQRVTYLSFGMVEHGIVKSISDADHVFVVYHCAGNWDQYFNYTAERTAISDLVPEWIEDAPQNVMEGPEELQPTAPCCEGEAPHAETGTSA